MLQLIQLLILQISLFVMSGSYAFAFGLRTFHLRHGLSNNISGSFQPLFKLSTLKESAIPFQIKGLHHCGVLVADVEQALRFYRLLGMEDVSHLRPKTLPYPGAFVQCGRHQLHLMQLPYPDGEAVRPEYVGRDKHIALGVNSVAALQKILDSASIPYKLSSSGRAALFCRDYDGNGYEFTEDQSVDP